MHIVKTMRFGTCPCERVIHNKNLKKTELTHCVLQVRTLKQLQLWKKCMKFKLWDTFLDGAMMKTNVLENSELPVSH